MPRISRGRELSGVVWLAMALAAPLASEAQQHLRDAEIHDTDTLAWWHTTVALSNDGMEGRDTGSAAYQRAADYVANRFKAAGLAPAGENGGYFQTVPMHEIAVVPEGTSFALIGANGAETALKFLQQITITPSENLAAKFEAPLTFRGYCGKEAMAEIAGKIVVCFGTQRQGLPTGSARAANAREGGAAGLISVDDPYFTIEPPRWPYAYARSVTLRMQAAEKSPPAPLASMRLSAEAFATLLAGTGQDAAAILKTGGSKQALANFEIPGKLRVQVHVTQRDISSPNILAKLPGSDAKLKSEFVVIAAHLDGYGFGTPVNGVSSFCQAYAAATMALAYPVTCPTQEVAKRIVPSIGPSGPALNGSGVFKEIGEGLGLAAAMIG